MSVVVRRGSTSRRSAALRTQFDSHTVTYPDVGSTLSSPPLGYHVARAELVIGHGNDDFARARNALGQWRSHRGAGIDVVGNPLIREGETVLMALPAFIVEFRISCRIVRVIDEPNRYGFAYGTLPTHIATGEELFVVTREQDGDVRYSITVFSNPRHLLMKVAGPIGRGVQRRFLQRYLCALIA